MCSIFGAIPCKRAPQPLGVISAYQPLALVNCSTQEKNFQFVGSRQSSRSTAASDPPDSPFSIKPIPSYRPATTRGQTSSKLEQVVSSFVLAKRPFGCFGGLSRLPVSGFSLLFFQAQRRRQGRLDRLGDSCGAAANSNPLVLRYTWCRGPAP